MSLRRWMYIAVVVAGGLAYLVWPRAKATNAEIIVNTSQAPADPEAARAEVMRVVAERNEEAQKERKVFEADGWEIVAAEPPDARVTSLDPSLIAEGREADLRVQLASTTPQKGHAHRLAQITVVAKEPQTREAASLALGRIRTPEAQEEIVRLLEGGKLDPEDLGRRQLAALLRPDDLDDVMAERMAGLLDSQALTPAEKEQVAFTLGLVGLRDGMKLPDEVTETMSAEARELVRRMTDLGQRSFLAHSHKHSE